jgi:hypothetical protein
VLLGAAGNPVISHWNSVADGSECRLFVFVIFLRSCSVVLLIDIR